MWSRRDPGTATARSVVSIWLLASLVQVDSVQAQTDPDSSGGIRRMRVAPVMVTAARPGKGLAAATRSVTRLTALPERAALAAVSFAPLLSNVPGVAVLDRGHRALGDRIMIRGMGARAAFGVRDVRVLLDDIPLTYADGQSQLDIVDLTNPHSIEVLRGPGSPRFANATGGVISMRTLWREAEGWRVTARIAGGSHGLRDAGARLAWDDRTHGLRLNARTYRSSGFRQHAAAAGSWVGGAYRQTIGRRVKLNGVFHFQNSPYLLNPGTLDAGAATENPSQSRQFVVQQGAGKQARHLQAGATLVYAHEDGAELRSTVFGVRRNVLNPIPGRIVDLDRKAIGARMTYSRALAAGPVAARVLVGVDAERQDDHRMEWENEGVTGAGPLPENAALFDRLGYGALEEDQNERIDLLGAFLEMEFGGPGPVTVSTGLRFDQTVFRVTPTGNQSGSTGNKLKMQGVSPTIGALWRASEQFSVFADINSARRTPTTTEISNNPAGTPGPNPEIRQGRVNSSEIGARAYLPALRLAAVASVYRIRLSDVPVPFQAAGGASEVVFYRNAGAMKNRGAEVQLAWNAGGVISGIATWSKMRFQFEEFSAVAASSPDPVDLSGNRVPGVPSSVAEARLQLYPLNIAMLEVGLHRTGEIFADDTNRAMEGFREPPRTLLGLLARVTGRSGQGEFRIQMELRNVLDARYNGSIVPNARGNRFFEPAPGRTWVLGVSFGFGGKAGAP